MKKEKILINLENLETIEEYKKIGINNFLFAVDYFSIGYKTNSLETIKKLECNKYLLINRIFNSLDVDKFKEFVKNLDGIDGVIFEDISVYNILKDSDIKLIWNQNHFATNYSSINYWLEMVNSAIISNELTCDEVFNILEKSNKSLVLNIFGKNNIMYSRRTLLTNFNKKFNLENRDEVVLEESITNNEFLVKESDKGTLFFNNKYFNLVSYVDKFRDDKILFYLINTHGLDFKTICSIINLDNVTLGDDGFMNRKTIYKLGDRK